MPLFTVGKRTRQEPLQRGGSLFEFYANCTRPGYDQFRSAVTVWLEEMAPDDQAELIARMQNGGNRAFRAALFELMIHATLVRLDHEVTVHPAIPNANRQPDFKSVHKQSLATTYVEATTINPPDGDDAERNRETPLYNAVDQARLPPGCILGYELVRAGSDSPSVRDVPQLIEVWARENEEAARAVPVSAIFDFDEWRIELELFAGRGNEAAAQAIGVVNEGPGWIAPHQDLRSALDRKARRYGAMNSPYLIAVADAKDQMWGGQRNVDATFDALLGDEVVEVAEGRDPRAVRQRNGFWFSAGAPSNQNVSAVLVFPSAQLWKLRDDRQQPILVINPWANHALPEAFKALPHFAWEEQTWKRCEGTDLADILGLPIPWPPEEDG